ncbi:MAG: hypothetical protein EA363_13635 [Balneolaceae bacterium]|nr:MAG: hypothetical protein EA363_13635 [Balneolaceae bacterium]
MRNRYVFYLVLAAMLVAGCGSDSPTGPKSSPGEWSAKVTGDVSTEMSGQAVFNSQGFDPITGTPGLLITLASASPRTGLGLFLVFPGDSRPGQAAYEVGQYDTSAENLIKQEQDPDRVYVQVLVPDEGGTELFFSVSGRVRITTSASNAIGGEFELTARTTDFENEGEKFVEVKGDFAAIGFF